MHFQFETLLSTFYSPYVSSLLTKIFGSDWDYFANQSTRFLLGWYQGFTHSLNYVVAKRQPHPIFDLIQIDSSRVEDSTKAVTRIAVNPGEGLDSVVVESFAKIDAAFSAAIPAPQASSSSSMLPTSNSSSSTNILKKLNVAQDKVKRLKVELAAAEEEVKMLESQNVSPEQSNFPNTISSSASSSSTSSSSSLTFSSLFASQQSNSSENTPMVPRHNTPL